MRQPDYMPSKIPFNQGVNLVWERGTLPTGSFSRFQNMRWKGDGAEQRLGQTRHHTTTAHATKEITSMYQFSKSGQTERRLFAQYDTGLIEEATDNPPTVTTGNFGSTALAARTGSSPASWGMIQDMCIMSDGAGQHQIHTGSLEKPVLVNVYISAAAIPEIPEAGADYTQEATDGLSTTVVVLDGIDSSNDALFIGFSVPVNKITFTIPATNDEASVATVSYRKNDSTWADSSDTDGTDVGGDTFKQTGSFTWTQPTDEIPHYAFGRSCFMYRITFSAALDAEVEVSAITGENTAGFQDIQNVWDGIPPYAVEAILYDDSASTAQSYEGSFSRNADRDARQANKPIEYSNMSAQSFEPGDMAVADYIYFSSQDPIFGFRLDVGKTPNTTASTTIDAADYWNGTAWTTLSLSATNEGTNGGANSGFVTWARKVARKSNFNSSSYHAYWYRFSFDKVLSASLTWSIQTLPYFDINDISTTGQTNATWKDRMSYSFQDNYIHFSVKNKPMVLNGDDYGLIGAGDGRKNKVKAMVRFYNELFAFQEEKGRDGGCLTVIEGDAPENYSKLVLSTQIGIMNAKCVAVLEDVDISELNKERPIFKALFWLSRYGVFKCDGRVVKNVSGGIANFFDATQSEVVRVGYEDKHWLEWDPTYNVLRIGLVSGGSATEPNIFLVYNPVTGVWGTDTLGQDLSCMTNVEAASGDISVLQYGGTQDGFVMQFNTTTNDTAASSTAIDADVIMELDSEKDRLRVKQELMKCKVQSAGDISRSVSINGNTTYTNARTIGMTARIAGESYRREEKLTDDIEGEHLSFRWRNNTASQSMYLLDVEFRLQPKYNR